MEGSNNREVGRREHSGKWEQRGQKKMEGRGGSKKGRTADDIEEMGGNRGLQERKDDEGTVGKVRRGVSNGDRGIGDSKLDRVRRETRRCWGWNGHDERKEYCKM